MRCPFCGNVDTQVKDSRPAEDHVAIRRRRFCAACGGRFTTYEKVEHRLNVVPGGTDIGTLVKALNMLGVKPQDLIAILQALKSSGALAAELRFI